MIGFVFALSQFSHCFEIGYCIRVSVATQDFGIDCSNANLVFSPTKDLQFKFQAMFKLAKETYS